MIKYVLCMCLLCANATETLAKDAPACPAPVRLGQISGLEYPLRFAVAGHYAYLLNDSGQELLTINLAAQGLEVVDTLVFESNVFHGIIVHDHAAYLTNGADDIQVLDLTDPEHPAMGELVLLKGFALVYRPVVIGDYLYAGTTDIYDITDPLHPVHAASMDLPHPIADMQHGLAYTTRMQPVDLSDPLHPVVDPSATEFIGSEYTQVDIDPLTHTLYASSTDNMAIYDIADPSAPELLYDQRLYADNDNYRSARIGSLLFVNGAYPSDIRVLDASSHEGLNEPPLSLDLFDQYYEQARFIQLIGGIFYIVSDHNFGAYSISTTPYTAAHRTEGSTNDILRHNELVITSEEGFGIEILDASDPADLRLVARYPGLDSVSAAAASGDTLYLAADRDDLIVLDISDPTNPTLIRTIDTGRRARDAAVIDDTLFVVDRTGGLSIFDITDPTDPQLRSSLDTPGWNEDISFSEDHQFACIASGRFDALLLDISDLDHPQVISTIAPLDQSNSGIQTATFDAGLLYTPEFTEGYRIWDISDPAKPALLAHHPFSYPDEINDELDPIAYQLIPHNDKLLVANGNNGLAVFDNADPLTPIFDRYFRTRPNDNNSTASARRIVMDADLAYVAVYGGGVKVFDLTPCTPCLADFNNDDQLNFFDISAFLVAYQNQDPQADLTGDGELNFFDVSAMLVAFQAGCP